VGDRLRNLGGVVTDLTLFHDLFRGRTDAIGLDVGGVQHREVTRHDYEGHLAGHRPIGIFPMLAGNVVWFGAIDLDEPNFDLAEKMQEWLPSWSWVERSRSGNAHVWVFFEKPCAAWACRAVLRAATEAVGRRDVEIFPKQDQLKPGMVGNYINLPLFGNERPVITRGNQLNTAQDVWIEVERSAFLEYATKKRQDPDLWARRAAHLGAKPPEDRETRDFGTQKVLHRCASYIMDRKDSNPIRPGARHQVLFHLSKMFLNWEQATVEDALGWVRAVNEASVKPLPDNEVLRQFENAQRGEFTSTGCDDPLMAPYVDPKCPYVQ
jgi:hypothetical protein